MKKRRYGIKRMLVILSAVTVVACLIYFAFLSSVPEMLTMLKNGSEMEIEAYLRENNTFTGMLCTALLLMITVVSVFIPSSPIQIAAGVVYGTWKGFLICHIAGVVANTGVLFTARRLGSGMNSMLHLDRKGSGKLDFLRNSDTPAYMTFVACLVPVLPNGIVPYVAAKTKISVRDFAAAIFLGSALPVFIMCAIGSTLMEGSLLGAALLVMAMFTAVYLLWRYRDRILAYIKVRYPKLYR